MFNIPILFYIYNLVLKYCANELGVIDNFIYATTSKDSITLLILLIVVLVFTIRKQKINFTLTLLMYFQNTSTSTNITKIAINKEPIFGLMNKISLIHPILITALISLLIVFILNLTKLYKKKNKNLLNLSGNISILALLTGSFWSSQEVLWGGWWNWDLVEVSLFCIFIFFILVIHNNLKKSPTFNYLKYRTQIIQILYILYFTNHTPIINSIHSFVSLSSIFLSYNQLLFWLLTPLVVFNKNSPYLLYILTLYYVFTLKYIYTYLMAVTITSEFVIIKLFLCVYVSISLLCLRKKRYTTIAFLFTNVTPLIVLFYWLMFPICMNSLPVKNNLIISLRKIRFMYTHYRVFCLLLVYIYFIASNNCTLCDIYKSSLRYQLNLNVDCTIIKVRVNGIQYVDMGNGLRNKLSFIWDFKNLISNWSVSVPKKTNYMVSNFI